MIEIVNQSVNPYFNIASEEYLLKNFEHDCFMLWRNAPSLIIGKHQNTLAEININFAEKNDIKVVRRISGGGTVYHDLGNLNFTFITNHDNNKIINFALFLKPITELLNNYEINVKLNKRNNLFVENKKICGTAAHIHKNKIIHHGTLLFATNIDSLENAIKINYENFTDKSIKSVNNIVTNINEHIKTKISINEFAEQLSQKINADFISKEKYFLSDADILAINELVKTKYKTWEWNYGYSPNYNFNKSSKNNLLNISVEVKKGIITNLKIYGINNFSKIENILKGVKHLKSEIFNSIKNIEIENVSKGEFLELFF
ncbi:MAG: lipoate--protein ligase [Bacteroidetes bacterium CG_4_10_14_3_um_filter_31_20]|nr:MAG: lipoate--protein ligase [Bacteroidetes bacterium CG_4_10_14_3_um_filter_31_20]